MPSDRPALTDKERAVVRGVAAARTYSEIANDLGVTYDTVKTYAARIRAKLGVRSKVAMATWAVKHPKEVAGGLDAVAD
jgi:DNA-binding CsgD family transcriptional regulator